MDAVALSDVKSACKETTYKVGEVQHSFSIRSMFLAATVPKLEQDGSYKCDEHSQRMEFPMFAAVKEGSNGGPCKAIYYRMFEQEAMDFISTSGFILAQKYSPAILALYHEEARERFMNYARGENDAIIKSGLEELTEEVQSEFFWMDLTVLKDDKKGE